jgi:translation elongation factor EF-1alpha
MSFLLCGQTDSGKSTISGHLLYKVGYFSNLCEEDEKYYRKYLADIETSTQKSKFSILMDLIDGEITNNKSKTQDFNILNFSYPQIDSSDNPMRDCGISDVSENPKIQTYTIIDTPGHKLYIRALIAGLFKVHLDLVVIVLSNLDQEFSESFERGTVKEDLMLCRSTNCKNLLVLWNKSDLASISLLNKEIFVDYCRKLKFKNIEHLSVSGYVGDGLLDILKIVDKYREVDANGIVDGISNVVENMNIGVECLLYPPQETLITAGYECILHCQSGEYEVVIDAIKNVRNLQADSSIRVSRIVKSGVPILAKLVSKNKPIQTFIGDRVIFRSFSATLGFGVVRK